MGGCATMRVPPPGRVRARTSCSTIKDVMAGYFALAPHVLARIDALKKLGRGAPRQIPCILLAKL
jgi:hypothetical protein